jgi:signal transduction histidine kinase/CheY-like chemotaxis protein
MANDQRIMAAGRPEVAEELFTSPDGSRRVWRSTKVPFRGDDGEIIGLAGVSTDITELRAREDELQRINAELQAILETVPAAIWITRDPAAVKIDGNRMSREILRIPEPDANMSKSAPDAPVAHFDVFDVGGQPIAADDLPVQRAARGERVRDWRETIRFDDGEEISLIGNAEPLYDDEGVPRGAVAAFVDISALERAERALVEINASLEARIAAATAERETALAQLHEMQKLETLGQLTGGVAHDFNNLLTPIIGSLDLLRRRHGEDAREARLIDGALAAADRARVLVSRLLAFGRRQMLQPRAVDIAALVGDATEIITRTIGPQIPVRVEVPAGLPMARADPNQLELALLNLAVNARDAMPGGGQLIIAADAQTLDEPDADLGPGSYVRLSVADSGIGMTDDVRRRAIEPFYTTKGIGKGTGLGLSMVHGFVAQLGGALRLHSAPGQGTRVEMWLPRAAVGDDAVEAQAAGPAAAAPRSATLLLVDDDDLVRSGTAAMLGDLGYMVIEAAGGAAALELLRAQPGIDALVTDFLMAGMTGGDLLAAARQLRPGLPVLVVTGFADSASLQLDAPVLAKPYGAQELAAAVAALLEPAA